MRDFELMRLAKEARNGAYAPYSKYTVGAALLCKNGKVYLGSNVENASYGLSCCAERVALFKAITEGEKKFEKIAIAGGRFEENGENCPPCGACRQALAEFCDGDFQVLLQEENGIKAVALKELLPYAFGKEQVL